MAPHTPSNHSVYAIVGGERFLRAIALNDLLSKLFGSAEALDPTSFDGTEAELVEVLDDVRTGSLLGDPRVVVVDQADAFIKAHREKLERYCAEPSPTGVLIFLCQALPANTRLYRIIKKQDAVLKCEVPKKLAMLDWIVQRAIRVYGKRMTSAVARELRDNIGDGPGLLDSELAKLATFVGDRDTITLQDLEAITGHHREEIIFGVMDAMLSRDVSRALSLWRQVLATDRSANSPKSVGGLAAAMRRWLQARRLVDSGQSVRAAVQQVWIPNGDGLLPRVSTTTLEKMQRDLLAAELTTRSGLSDVQTAVEKWIVTHGAGTTARVAG